jgi:hypothetical protein
MVKRTYVFNNEWMNVYAVAANQPLLLSISLCMYVPREQSGQGFQALGHVDSEDAADQSGLGSGFSNNESDYRELRE